MPQVLILGGGLAGLSASYHLGADARILEREERVGGLARTDLVQGYSFDWTGHWLHLRDPYMKALVNDLLGDKLLTVERRAAIFSHGVFTPYPYQINTHGLPAPLVAENVLGFVEATLGPSGAELRAREPKSFLEFVLRYMGKGFARNFMVPYNQKLYQVPLEELSPEWVGRFVPRPSLEEVVHGALGIVKEGAGYNATFVYPRQGGIEALPRALAGKLRGPVELGAEVVSIDVVARRVRLADGRAFEYDKLVSTLPLPRLVALVEPCQAEVREAASRLRAIGVTSVEIGLSRDEGPRHHWVYFPEEKFAFYRCGAPSLVNPALAPPGHRSYQVEFSHVGKPDLEAMKQAAVEGLRAAGLLDPAHVALLRTRTIPTAYVIFDHAYGPARARALDWLAAQGIVVAGRYGNWEYSSMEDALLSGREAARRVSA